MAKLMKQMGSGKMPSLPGLAPAANGERAATARKTKSKRKKKKKARR